MKTTRLAMGVLAAMLAGCSTSPDVSGPQWKPIGNRAVRGAPGEIRTDLDFSVPLAKTLMLANMVVFAGKGTYAFDGTKTGHAAADAHARHAYRKGWEVA